MSERDEQPVVGHFFGGPRDGEWIALPRADRCIFFPTEPSIRWWEPRAPVETDWGIVSYFLRGPALSGHAYYDYRPDGGER